MGINIDTMSMEDIWLMIDEKLNGEPGPIAEMNTSYSFELDGEKYGLIFKDGKAETITGDPGEVDCTLSMSVKDFKKLLVGNLNSTASYMMGKLKVKGSLGLALKLESLLKQYSF